MGFALKKKQKQEQDENCFFSERIKTENFRLKKGDRQKMDKYH